MLKSGGEDLPKGMQKTDCDITIGKIVGTHGNKGLLKVLPLTDFPDRFLGMDSITLLLDGKEKKYTLLEASHHKRNVLLELKEIPDMTGAEALKGALIKIKREELTPLPDGSYYIFDIVGITVCTPGGDHLGVVEDIIQTGANDVYVINTGKPAPLLVPALKEVVREIDIKAGRMVVELPEEI